MILLLLAALLGMNLMAGNLSYQFDLTSRYIFRGIDILYNNKPAFQPSVTYNFDNSGFSLNAWGSFCLSDRSTYKYCDEIDLTLTYTFKTPKEYLLAVGFTNYGFFFAKHFTFKDSTAQEIFVKAGLPKVLFSPVFSLFYASDMGNDNLSDGLYMQISGTHTIKLDKKLNIDLSARLGYNAGQWIPKEAKTGFSDLTVGAALPIKMGKVTISPFVNVALVFLESINPDNEIWFGCSIIF
jgi:uncharacterized protein (TIGR02001 family)